MKRKAYAAIHYLNLDDPNAALGAVNGFSDLGCYTHKGGSLYAFALNDAR